MNNVDEIYFARKRGGFGQVGNLLRKRRNRNLKCIAAMVLIFCLFCIWYVDRSIKPVINEIAQVKAMAIATNVINQVVQEEMTKGNINYNDLVVIHKDEQGKIVFLQANTAKINAITSDITLAVQKSLEHLDDAYFYIPVGQLSGIYFLSNVGPGIKVSILPIGNIQVKLKDNFESVGINQTRHSIYVDFATKVKIALPFRSGEAEISTTVPLVDSLIVGDVPDTYGILPWGMVKSSES